MFNPFFSVIIPTYNRASFICKAIESVINQTFQEWELVIVDDGSKDNTKEVVERYKDERIIYVYQENKERSAARNKGIELSRGDYICFLDSDDYYTDSHLQYFYDTIKKADFPEAMFYCNAYEDNNGIITEVKNNIHVDSYKALKNIILFPIALVKVCISNKILSKIKFNESYRIAEDIDLWFRILKDYPLHHNDNYSVVINNHGSRTVIQEEMNARLCNLAMAKRLTNEYKQYFKRKDINEIISSSYFALAKTYFKFNKRFRMIYSLIFSMIYKRNDSKNKEKLYMILCAIGLKKNKI